MFFNPVSHLFINEYYPLAKVRRSEFEERFWDTFETINGKIVKNKRNKPLDAKIKPEEDHVGVLDYLLFPVLLPLMWWCKDNPNSNLTAFVMGIKSAISFFLTVVCVPFILIGHGISLAVNAKKDDKVKTLNIITDKNYDRSTETVVIHETTETVEMTRRERIETIEEKNCEGELWEIAPCDTRLEKATYVLNKENNIGKDELYLLINDIDNERWSPFSDYSFFNVKIPVKEENKAGIRWMLESNYNHILEKLPPQFLKELVNEIDQPVKPKLG